MDMSIDQTFDNSMQVDGETSVANRSEENASPLVKSFRTNSLLLASFPWFTCLPMVDTKISDLLNKDEKQGYHLGCALDDYDSFLKTQSIHNSPLKAILHEVNAESVPEISNDAITNRESSLLRSKEKANNLCSLLCAFRLLDVIVKLDLPSDQIQPPVHKKMGLNFSKNEKSLRSFANWTAILKKFRLNFISSKTDIETDESASNLPTQQLQALYRLHSNMNVDKSLINLQLAATHISFMLQQHAEKNTIPDFPGSPQEFSLLSSKFPPYTQNDGIDFYPAFLEKLAGEKQQMETLRLPLQMALLISPLFLLQDAQIHLSTFYTQRYKMALYSKALGNERPDIISELEHFIWDQLFGIANGNQTVHEAASKIANRIPENFDHLNEDTCGWFVLDPTNEKNCVNLTSLSVKEGTIPKSWPLGNILEARNPETSSSPSVNLRKRTGENRSHDSEPSALVPRKKSRTTSTNKQPQEKPSTKRKRSTRKRSQPSSTLSQQPNVTTSQRLPLVIGSKYLKIENIDLNELLAPRSNVSTEYVLLPESVHNSSPFIVHFHTFNIHGERLNHEFMTPFETLSTAVRNITTKIEDNFTLATETLCPEYVSTSKIKSITRSVVQEMSPLSFQKMLRSNHIIITDYNLPNISCDRKGLTSINSLKELINIEDQSVSETPQVKDGVLKQFVDNLELDVPNTLRIIRMKSYLGAESLPFSSDHAAWRDTVSDPYCTHETSENASLRWTDASTAHAIQSWKITPAGFGTFFDVRSGQQLVIIAAPGTSDDDTLHTFTHWDQYLQDFDRLSHEFSSSNGIEAIRLDPGNRLILRPNTPYVTITLEHAVITGGFYLSNHTLYETLIGKIHAFVLPSVLTEGTDPPFALFVRRVVHYMHNSYVKNDSSDHGHLLPLTTMDDARDLLSLVAIAIFLNAFDERTYMPSSDAVQDNPTIVQECHTIFDLNAIPVVERHHLCYVRGLALDLLVWFFENFFFTHEDFGEKEEEDVDAYTVIFAPFLVHIGRRIIRYKRHAEEHGHTTSPSLNQVSYQIQSALFGFQGMRDIWLESRSDEQERGHHEADSDTNSDQWDNQEDNDLDYNFSDFAIHPRKEPESRRSSARKLLEDGKTMADERFFRGLDSQFDLKKFEQSNDEDSDFFSA